MTSITERIAQVQARITAAADRVSRDRDTITLVAVSKTWPIEHLQAAYTAGVRHFGENRTYELSEKRPKFTADDIDDIVWHYIGHLQSRQSQAVADLADVFHAVDRTKIINRLGRQLDDNGRTLRVLIEVNVSGEASKSGFDCQNWENDNNQLATMLAAAKTIQGFDGLKLDGLMTMAPWGAPEPTIRNIFQRTRQLRDAIQDQLSTSLPHLSMGMTDDYEIAIEEGATQVRVGRAIFGSRN